ncbi:phage-related integrase [Gordonia terrae C-6]|uniref:Phage-related integrase n=1 Tax=Gordonia terrae C-6 TaxID=1316928 RepID=R7Y560_9ACTN|nr:site-specific integrase [Gordonia terrae]EON30829.1 phage-related integrase [Gordonia terrae C-6]
MATVESYTNKAGKRYVVRYRTPSGQQTMKRGFRTKADATAYATTIENAKLTGAYVAPSKGRVTVSTVASSWLNRQVHSKESWRTRQESLWRVHVEPKWGDRAVKTIEPGEIKDWIGELSTGDDKRAPSTVQDIHGVLVAILDVAKEEHRIQVNPARGVKLPRRQHVEHNYLDHAQLVQLAAEVSRHEEIVMLLAYSGLRWGEMAALRPRDVDLDRGRINITRSASKVNSRSIIGATKTWERRTVAIPAEVAELLRAPVTSTGTNDLLWTREDGTPLRPPTTTHWFTKAVHRLAKPERDGNKNLVRDETGNLISTTGFPIVTAHELRHTAASLMIRSGAHVKTVQRQLGHKSATMTLDLYGHLFDDDLDEIAVRMGEGLRHARGSSCAQNVLITPTPVDADNGKSPPPA